jgi:alpha-D-xyloside xylohydrolase
MRFHGTGRREPFAYPEPYRTAAVAACRLRRELQPDLLAAARTATQLGVPVMRPMVLACPGDRSARDADLQYLLGDDILVAPVLQPGGRLTVWIPPGGWYGLRGAPDLEGPGWVDLRLDLAAVPAWTRTPRGTAGG